MRHLKALYVISFIFGSCSSQDHSHDHDMAKQLFEKSIVLISGYIDSLRNAPDSAAIISITNNYDYKAGNLNFEFPANTDMHLTEEENDSLIRMTERMVRIRKERLYSFAHVNDSLPSNTDSIKISNLPTERVVQKDSLVTK